MYDNIRKTILLVACLLAVITPALSKASAEYPGRELYLDAKYISLEDLKKEFNDVIVIDTRSSYEFKTLHIKNAINIPLTSSNFKTLFKELRTKFPAKKFVTYCNGKTCMKSYQAVRKAQNDGVSNIVAYDAGIFDWVKTYPDLATLLGTSPVDPAKLITKESFSKKLLEPKDFMNNARASNGIIVDARDPLQRDGVSLFVGKEKRAPLEDENAMRDVINIAISENKPLFIYDESGKQVQWLMYRLEQRNVKDYFFMKGGTREFYKNLSNEMNKN